MPKTVICEECGWTAKVRGYGRVEYAWPENDQCERTLEIIMIRLTIDCPRCGIRTQDYHPAGAGSLSSRA
jgi:hypothetical protein